ncbi:MAG: acyltransferase [Bacteroidota bacterium]|nr:acyltransferase [Bacteroidota bacterium]
MSSLTKSIPQLTFTRFLAAVAVVIFHYGQKAFPFQTGFLNAVAKESGITVSYFFFLSGFLLYIVYSQHEFSARKFFVARAGRILPLYYLGFFLSLFVMLVLQDIPAWGSAILTQGLMIHAWFPGMSLTINYPAWSVSVEVFFYILFPLILVLSRKISMRNFIILAVILWLAGIGQNMLVQHLVYDPTSTKAGDFIMYFPPWHLNTFVSGIACGMIFLSLKNKIQTKGPVPLLISLAGLSGVICILVTDNPLKHLMHLGMLAPLYAMIVLGIALDKTIIARIMSLRPMQFLGEISYGIYLLQFPVWAMIEYTTRSTDFVQESTFGFYVCLSTLLLVSALSYQYFEKPARFYIRRRFERGKPEKV